MAVRSQDVPDLRRLLAEWNRRLYEDGHDDIETAGPDGPVWDQVSNGGQLGGYDFAAGSVGQGAEQGQNDYGVLLMALAVHNEACEALYSPAVWRGLPPRARRWWALQALAGLSHTRARHLARVPQHRAERWRAMILARIATARRHEADDD